MVVFKRLRHTPGSAQIWWHATYLIVLELMFMMSAPPLQTQTVARPLSTLFMLFNFLWYYLTSCLMVDLQYYLAEEILFRFMSAVSDSVAVPEDSIGRVAYFDHFDVCSTALRD